MKIVKVKAVLVRDETGEHYLIHGSSDETPEAMFKSISHIWGFNPATEHAHYLEFELAVPDRESLSEVAHDTGNN